MGNGKPAAGRTSDPGLQFLVGSMIIFGTIGIFRRYIPLPSDVLACGRGAVGGAFLLLFMKGRGLKFASDRITRRNFLLLVLTGAMIGFNWILLFEAYRYTTVAVATLCYYMQPVIVLLLSPIVLKEHINRRQMFFAAMSVFGMILVSGVIGEAPAGTDNARGILLGLGAAVLYASVVLLNKQILGVPVYEKTIIQLLSAAAAMLPYMALTGSMKAYPLSTREAVLFAAVCLLHTGIAYAMYFASIEQLPARTCALLSYIDPVTAVLLSALLLHEAMTWWGIAGTVLIIGSAILSEMT